MDMHRNFEKNEVGKVKLPDFKTYHKTIITKKRC